MPKSITKVPEATSVGDRLRWIRTLKGLTLKQFSERVNCDPGYLSKLESGKSLNPSPRFLVHLSMAFFVNADWLISGAGQPFGNDKTAETTIKKSADDSSLRVFAVLDELPSALAGERVLAVLLKDYSLKELQEIWSEVRCLPNLPTTAIHFWNEVFMRTQFQKINFGSQKTELDKLSDIGNMSDVKAKLPALLKRLNEATRERGTKTELAKFMDVQLPNVSQWLSGEREPSGETTLRLQAWVEQQERQK